MLIPLLAHNATLDPLPLPYVPPTDDGPLTMRQYENEEVEIDIHMWITPLYLAVECGHLEVVQQLVSHKCHISPDIGILAAQVGNAAVVEELIANCEQLRNERLMLFWAALNGMKDVVEVLVQCGMDASGSVGDGMTALHCAAMRGSAEVVEWLVEKGGVQINEVTEEGMTALHFAVEQGRREVVEYLVKKGADVNAKTIHGSTPLYIAS